jgi:hypothetical protein
MSFSLENINTSSYEMGFILIKNNSGFCYDKNKSFILESNDSCYLFNGICNPPQIVSEDTFLNFKIIPFLTNFHTGVHAYSGIYSMLNEYMKNYNLYVDYKICVYKNIQKGILDILYEFFDKSKIVLLNQDIVYRFSEIKIIPNSLHSFLENKNITKEISELLITKVKKSNNEIYPKKIAIFKTFDTSVTSTMGAINFDDAKNYCINNGYDLIIPEKLGEVNLINYINNCEEIIFSWGTTFMKNFIFISEKCLKSKVFVFGNEFNYEYNDAIRRDILIQKYKNCTFEYVINELK